MTTSSDCPDRRVTEVTFRAEAVRAFAAGIQETAFSTFAILIAVKHFALGPAAKASIISSLAIGLLGGLFVVPLIARLHWKVSHAAAVIHLISMLGFLLASITRDSELMYLVGMCVGMGIISMAIPLQTHYLKANFPDSSRGRLFSVSILIRGDFCDSI